MGKKGEETYEKEVPVEFVLKFDLKENKTEWVNVVIPGFGHCQVRQNDLAFQEEYDQQMPVNKLASLTICFDKFKEERDEADNGDDDDDRDDSNSDDIEAEAPNNEDGAKTSFQTDGLAHFLERVGSSLKILSLDGPRGEIDENLILQHCPNLEKLSLCGGLVDVQLCFSEYRARNQPVPQLDCHWHDVFALSADLSDPANPLHKCVHQLRVRLKDAWEGWKIVQGSYNPPGFKSRADELLKMLDKNQSLEYCEVIAPIEHKDYAKQFSKHHLQLIKRCIQPFRLGMIGFLSVISSLQASSQEKKKRKSTSPEAGRALCDLNQLVLSNIFEFAADRVIRQVYFHSQDGLDWDSVTEGFLIV